MRHVRRVLLMSILCMLLPILGLAQTHLINGDEVIVGVRNYCEDTNGDANANTYICSFATSPLAYVTGTRYSFKAGSTNTAAATVNINALGAKTIKKYVGGAQVDLASGDICNAQQVDVMYDGTFMNLLSGRCNDANTTAQTRSIYIPAGSMDVEGTCAANATAVLVTTGPKLVTIGCTDTNTDGIDFDFVMPDGWDAGTITIELDAFSIGNNSTEVFSMNFSGQCVRGGSDAVAAHTVTSGATATSTTNRAATITWPAAANREEHATTAPLTLNGTCAAGAHVYMHGLVDATTTTMTPMTDLKILGVKVEYHEDGQ
jgi:hypothetical protein